MLNPVMSNLRKTSVLVAHEDQVLSAGIAAVLGTSVDLHVVVANPERQWSEDAESLRRVDVVIADLAYGLRAAALGRKVLVLARDDGESAVRTALQSGIRGFLLQNCSVQELTAAVRTIGSGQSALAPSVAARMAESFGYQELTSREVEVLNLMIAGFCDKQIAKEMGVATGTVKSHMKSILTKLRAARRTEAAAIAQQRGIARLNWAVTGSRRE
jgi:DNA-binding NarL/FixJ family response regulator